LLPSRVYSEATFKGSKMIMVFDVSESMFKGKDDVLEEGQDPKKLPSRQDKVIKWLSDTDKDGATVLERLLTKTPVSIYRFGGLLDERNVKHFPQMEKGLTDKQRDDWRKSLWGVAEWTDFLDPKTDRVKKPAILVEAEKWKPEQREAKKQELDEADKRYQDDLHMVGDLRRGTNIGRALH